MIEENNILFERAKEILRDYQIKKDIEEAKKPKQGYVTFYLLEGYVILKKDDSLKMFIQTFPKLIDYDYITNLHYKRESWFLKIGGWGKLKDYIEKKYLHKFNGITNLRRSCEVNSSMTTWFTDYKPYLSITFKSSNKNECKKIIQEIFLDLQKEFPILRRYKIRYREFEKLLI